MRKGEKHVPQKMSKEERFKGVVLTDELLYKLSYIREHLDMTISEVFREALDEYFARNADCSDEEFRAWVKKREEDWREFKIDRL